MKNTSMTFAPVRVGDCAGQLSEFGRWRDVERLYGIKRGSLYGLLVDGKIKGVLLRIRGRKSGVRLFDLASVRDYIRQCQAEEAAHLATQTRRETTPRKAGL